MTFSTTPREPAMRITNLPQGSADTQPVADAPALAADIEADFWRELQALEAEALGWQELGPGSYLHTGSGDDSTIEVVGLPSANMAGLQVLWLF